MFNNQKSSFNNLVDAENKLLFASGETNGGMAVWVDKKVQRLKLWLPISTK